MIDWRSQFEDWLDFLDFVVLVSFAWLDMLAYMEMYYCAPPQEAEVINFDKYKAKTG